MKPTVSLPQLAKCMIVTHKGRRYFYRGPVVFTVKTEPKVLRYKWRFWSDHKYPWYAGSVTLLENDAMAAGRAFCNWLPFSVEVE